MRLINTTTGQLEEFIGRRVPPYAALSHTWGNSEVTLQEWTSLSGAPGAGLDKITTACSLAAQDGLGYVWADTCCIDKTSSAELSEAINSMYAWYARCVTCYVYLADLEPRADLDAALPRCRWFTRGWTLQELIAPKRVVFYDRTWTARAEKREILDLLADITGIDRAVLNRDAPLATRSTAEKMSWAAHRKTTRVEDVAYCLLGIFGINLPLVYGEQERAFRRLQEEIIRTTSDLSIFAWQMPHHNNSSIRREDELYSGFLASSPRAFASCQITSRMPFGHWEEFSVTNCGIKTTRVRLYLYISGTCHDRVSLFPVHWDRRGKLALGVRVRKCGADRYVRAYPFSLVAVDSRRDFFAASPEAQIYLLTDLPVTAPGSDLLMNHAQLLALHGAVLQFQSVGPHQMTDFWPEARCDSQNDVFFTAGSPWQDATIVRCTVWAADGSGTREENVVPRAPTFGVACLVAGWGRAERPPQISVVATDGSVRGVTEKLFSGITQRHLDTAALLKHLRFVGVPRREETRFLVGDGRQIRVSYGLTLEEDEKVCETKFWRVTMFVDTEPVRQRSPVVDEGWALDAKEEEEQEEEEDEDDRG